MILSSPLPTALLKQRMPNQPNLRITSCNKSIAKHSNNYHSNHNTRCLMVRPQTTIWR
jgi:hypothetical protein